ncbi:ABC-type spermidine/putrescine transport system,permease component II [Halanaeroarchaeum sp. HSR-CO]|uniref:ABC transporter permease n=1 Tax=Halanaeroarchaeum sp. HSR-CO TaxID=2866382 RepID=UPI00217F0B36|nr:ABC transporter permease [Halanaeroarchaeum sp. HSR-CO]UWG47524.1 ABC-type spermidine/putrescine transport system,permease component II [Halanaeroarchaeum sp. HSR-CO]
MRSDGGRSPTDSLSALARRLPGERPLLSTLVALEIVFLLVPTLIVLLASFQPGDIIQFPPDSLSLYWYTTLPGQERYFGAFARSLFVALFATVLSIPVGVATGLGMMRYDIRFESGLQIYLLLPFTVPLVVSGMILLLVFREVGVLGQLWTVGLALAIINLPFMIWSVSARVNALDPELERAAMNLGAEELQTFVHVTLPSLLPGIVTGSLIVFVLGLNEFLVSLLITTPDIVTLPVLIYTSIRANVSPVIAAVASVYVLVAFVAVLVADRLVGLEAFLRS